MSVLLLNLHCLYFVLLLFWCEGQESSQWFPGYLVELCYINFWHKEQYWISQRQVR